MKRLAFVSLTALLLLIGCTDQSNGPNTSAGMAPQLELLGTTGLERGVVTTGWHDSSRTAIDSVRVTSAIIVLKDIAFHSRIDTAHVKDSTEVSCDDRDEYEGKGRGFKHWGMTHFRGPFVVELLNGVPTQIVLDTIPPGVYNGIKFILHKLHRKDVEENPTFPDSLVGFSVVVFGTVYYEGQAGAPFVFKADINEEFKVRGNFEVPEGSNLVPYALDFAMNSWFVGKNRVLDPNGYFDRKWIRWNIKHAFKDLMRVGRDWNRDGRPDH